MNMTQPVSLMGTLWPEAMTTPDGGSPMMSQIKTPSKNP